MFGDRDTWFNHELKHHHSLYVCKLCECQYTATELLEQHIINEHRPYTHEEIKSVIEHGKLVPSQLKAQDCPFCDDWASILSHRRHRTDEQISFGVEKTDVVVSLTRFKRHVATHQEQLAVFAMPRMVDDDDERNHETGNSKSGVLSSENADSHISDDGAHPIGESTTYELSSTCIYLSGLPPNVRSLNIQTQVDLTESAKLTLLDGSCFIEFGNPHDAAKAVAKFNGYVTILDKPVKVQYALLKRDPKTGEMRVVEDLDAYDFDPAPTNENSASVLANVEVSRNQDVAFKPKPPTPNDTTEWYLGTVKQVLGEGKGRRYIVRDEDPDVPSPARKEYKMSASGIIPIPPPSTELPRLDRGKIVLALYPDSTTFYKAEVMGTRMENGTENVFLKFEGEHLHGVQQVVERRFVVDYRD